MGHNQVVFCHDPAVGLKAIIAVHDLTLGPALGGCRFWNYEREEDAIDDVLRLSRGMTYKAAVAGLNLGGGKSVIIGDPKKLKSEAFFRSFGRFVNSLGGRYITAEDVNISVADMEFVAKETPHVTGLSSKPGGSGDPSPVTALGVFSGIQAAVRHKLRRDSLKGLTVAVQGVGHVGSYLCQYLHEAGAKLIVADISEERVAKIKDTYGAAAASVDQIHAANCDVFAPCALGGILNDQTIPAIKAQIVAGGANNQLRDENRHGAVLRERNILYAPDYVINAGGLINVYHELKGNFNAEAAKEQARGISKTLTEIFEVADKEGILTHVASARVAERRIAAHKKA
jgi:leucine dehydrogenase